MTELSIDFGRSIGKIKPMHAVGQPPFGGGFLKFDFSHMRHLKNANIPYSRLHDVGGAFGGNRFVDIPNLFRDFDADENDPASYDFAFTDTLLAAMHEYGIAPYFRLGVTIENQAHIKAYRIHPPKDYAKWARICEHVIRHYNEGWADGFTYGIKYWEIWNEPDNGGTGKNQMWTGTPEQYYELYDVTAKHLKACFGDSIKVGGYSCCALYGIFFHPERYGVEIEPRDPGSLYEKGMHRVEFFLGFLEYLKEHRSPMDFFSWHSYLDVQDTLILDSFIHERLSRIGYGGVEMHLTEWNNAHKNENHGTSQASAAAAAMMCAMQDSHTEMLCYYDSRLQASSYGGFFAPLTYEPVCTYYAFAALGELYALGTQVSCEGMGDGLYALAATDGERKAVLVVNYSDRERTVRLNVDESFSAYLLDQTHYLEKQDGGATQLMLGANQVVLVKNH